MQSIQSLLYFSQSILQLLACQFVLGIALAAHLLFKPYKDKILSSLESASLCTLLCTTTLLLYDANISILQKDQDLNYAATAYPTMGYSTNEILQNLMNVSISAINVIMIIVFSLAVGQACKECQQPSEV
jgi:flagellar biosynthesis protein FlhB